MLVFIDDSGDPGFKLNKGSSSHFVIACVIFTNNQDAEKTANKIREFRRSLGWHEKSEFKFNKLKRKIRLDFLNVVKDCNFRVRAIVADKSKIYSLELRNNDHSFYNFMIKEVLYNSNGGIRNAKIRLDGHGDHDYKKAAKAYFRKQVNLNTQIIQDLKFVDSKVDNLIQLADMVAGSILRSKHPDKTDHAEYLTAIRGQIEDLWEFQ